MLFLLALLFSCLTSADKRRRPGDRSGLEALALGLRVPRFTAEARRDAAFALAFAFAVLVVRSVELMATDLPTGAGASSSSLPVVYSLRQETSKGSWSVRVLS